MPPPPPFAPFQAGAAPDPFAAYLRTDNRKRTVVLRLPAEDDPMARRIRAIRERDYLLLDTLNAHFDNFYREMKSPYLEWRRARSAVCMHTDTRRWQ